MGLDVKAETTQDVTEEVTVEPMDEDEQITEEVGISFRDHPFRLNL